MFGCSECDEHGTSGHKFTVLVDFLPSNESTGILNKYFELEGDVFKEE
jgi:hypothetical protein